MQPFRLTSFFILILLLGTVVAAACTNDDRASTVAETPPLAASTPDVEAIVETAVREMLEAIPTPAPAPTPDIEAIVETVLQRTTGTLFETLVAGLSVDTETTEDTQLSPEPIPVPAPQGEAVEVQALPASGSGGFLSFGGAGFGALPIAQEVTEAVGLTVTANGSVKVSADEAYVVVIPEQFYGRGGPEKLSSEDREDVVQNLMAIGIGEDDVEFASGQQYDPETISVEVQIGNLPEIGDLILDAVEDVVRRSERSGVRFGVSGQNCDQALAAARQEAITQAEGDSLDLAKALGLVRGGIIAALESPANSFGPGLPSLDKCGGGQFHPYQTPLIPFDADPEVEVSLQMRITYGPESELTGGLTATANGSTTVPADDAYVVVIPEQFYGPGGPEKLSGEDRDDVAQNLMDMGIGEDDIEFEYGQPYGPETISVEVQIGDLPEIGDLILNAMEDVIRRSEHSGVRFTLSEENCDEALGLARLDAISQIDRKADDLVAALGMVRGGVVGAVEDPFSDFRYGPGSADRCGGLSQDPYALLSFDAEPSVDVVLPLQLTYAPQSDETGGLVAVASISQTVTADEAYVVVIPQRFYGPRGPEPLSMEDRADVIDKLTELGIASGDIEIVSGRQPYDPVQISVEVAVADLPEIGERILDSVEEVLRRSENSGVRFGLSEESCNAGLALARRDAASQADKDADGLAEAIGVVRGGVVSVAEYSLGGFNYGSTSTATCDGQFQDHNALLPFDAEPKIEVAVQIRIGYAISR
jgi:uncharacterized protein YggE